MYISVHACVQVCVCMWVFNGEKQRLINQLEKCSIGFTWDLPPPHPCCSLSQGKVGVEVTGRCAMSQRSEKHKTVSILGSQFCC